MSTATDEPATVSTPRPASRSRRITGLDLARGLAVCGMFAAHVGPGPDVGGVTGALMEATHGRSSILFATLAGVSLALLTRPRPQVGDRSMRVRVAIRALLILALGAGLVAWGTPVAVILAYYGVFFLLAIPFLRVRPSILFTLAGIWAVVGPITSFLLLREQGALDVLQRLTDADPLQRFSGEGLVLLLVDGTYPAWTWMPFLLVGLGIGRLGVAQLRRRVLLAVGTGLAVLGYGGSWLAERMTQDVGAGDGDVGWTGLLGHGEHSGTPFEIIGSTGVALAVIAVCLWLAPRFPRATRPLVAVGTMSLTVYTLHVLAINTFPETIYPMGTSLWVWLAFIAGAIAVAVCWLRFFRRGPLEQVVHVVSTRGAALLPGPDTDRVRSGTRPDHGR